MFTRSGWERLWPDHKIKCLYLKRGWRVLEDDGHGKYSLDVMLGWVVLSIIFFNIFPSIYNQKYSWGDSLYYIPVPYYKYYASYVSMWRAQARFVYIVKLMLNFLIMMILIVVLHCWNGIHIPIPFVWFNLCFQIVPVLPRRSISLYWNTCITPYPARQILQQCS